MSGQERVGQYPEKSSWVRFQRNVYRNHKNRLKEWERFGSELWTWKTSVATWYSTYLQHHRMPHACSLSVEPLPTSRCCLNEYKSAIAPNPRAKILCNTLGRLSGEVAESVGLHTLGWGC